jgi:hypothetical protein
MDTGERMTVAVVGIITAGIVFFTAVLAVRSLEIHRAAFENGYEEIQIEGSTVTRWSKVYDAPATLEE